MHEQLENYLSQVEKQLAPLTNEKRNAELREIELHLQMMIEDYIAIGDSPDEAVAAAVRQFDAAGKLGRELQQAQTPDRLRRWRPLLAAVACGASYTLAYSLFCVFLEIFIFLNPSPPYNSDTSPPYHFWNPIMISSGFVGGWAAEIVSPRKAIWSVVVLHLFVLYNSRGVTFGQSLQNVIMPLAASVAACLGLWLRQRQVAKRAQKNLTLTR